MLASLAKFEIAQWNLVPLSQPFEFRMFLPDLLKIIPVDSAQLYMAHLNARSHNPVGTHSDLIHRAITRTEKASPFNRILPLLMGLFHLEPISCLSKRTRACADAVVVFLVELQKGFHGKRPFFHGELDLISIFPTEAHVGSRIG